MSPQLGRMKGPRILKLRLLHRTVGRSAGVMVRSLFVRDAFGPLPSLSRLWAFDLLQFNGVRSESGYFFPCLNWADFCAEGAGLVCFTTSPTGTEKAAFLSAFACWAVKV